MRQAIAPTLLSASGAVWAGGVPTADLGEIEVSAVRTTLLGNPVSATDGIVLREQLEHRPVLRTGELLEAVPGLIVTQHSGSGKANQFFLRGFNLDHGTDFATRVDGVPVNMPTHAHGQGYTDVNFVIPELIGSIEYHKGTHHAAEGNFSAAGAAHIRYADSLGGNLLSFTGGEDDYRRAVLAGSPAGPCSMDWSTRKPMDPGTCRRTWSARTPCCVTRGAMSTMAGPSRRWRMRANGSRPTRCRYVHPVEPRTVRVGLRARF
ncbi:MAG TPA: Plug domain-containing protein [Steroidobacteraceae bacterium]|nr:Plug domain-containing protein [Steroidobacteraceae bacterium]